MYQDTMKGLEDEVTNLQQERENLSSALENAKTNSAASKVSEQRRKRLQELESQISELRKKMTEQKKLLKLKDNSDKQVSKISGEIMALKQQRVSLMKQMKTYSDKYRQLRQQKDKEVLQLQQKDRKRQFEIQKQKRDNQRIQAVLNRKSEEAAAANRRLKDALGKQKRVLEERNQKFEKCDNTSIGNRIRKWLSHELDVKVGVMEAKYHCESLLKDRKLLAEELKTFKESLDDDAPPSKKMAWMDDSGQKCEISFKEEQTKEKIESLKHQIELRNVQIADLQQKFFDADQKGKGKSTHENLRTMMEAKSAIKWLLEQAVSFKADNNRVRLEVGELKETLDENGSDNGHYIEELERDLEEMKKTHASTIIKLRREHQKEFLDDKEPDGNPVAESTPKKTEHQAAGDAGNQSLESNTSNYATSNHSFNDSLSMENQSSAGGVVVEVPVGQLVDIPLQDTSSEFLDDKEPDGNPVAESTPKKTEHQAAGDAGNQSLESNTSNYATSNHSFNDSLSMENQSSAGGVVVEVPVGQLVDIPLQDTSSEAPLPRTDHLGHTLEFFVDNLPGKLVEGNKTRGAIEQLRTDGGHFGAKRFIDCSWRTWLKRMYSLHPGVVCQCTCNDRPIRSAQALIQHIQRKHYVNKKVMLGGNVITVE